MRCTACNVLLEDSDLLFKDEEGNHVDFCSTCRKLSEEEDDYTYDHIFQHKWSDLPFDLGDGKMGNPDEGFKGFDPIRDHFN